MLMNAVAKIEYMTVAGTELFQNHGNFLANFFRLCIENRRVHIALQGDLVTNTFAGISYIYGPVETDTISATIGNLLQP